MAVASDASRIRRETESEDKRDQKTNGISIFVDRL
jgi:hypothetical protein